ncbi:hypothetical protein [Variovorax ginsengisoli]|uniref:Peptidase M48 domain-containing protein n=1 Tax=Variovorax ginsengisoli TaxID=363844 RepID=A0ABT8SBR8_9BURK|nr:hypothetical protein [Variovorax ginsengisoli]MDN8617194.1 hypothetical protein [Variovorax ginsengisoli]MDO1536364.1 hypothetical protein [Variovorax ginsengisoli]
MGDQERADLEALLAAPERIEIHGGDRMWRAHLLGAIMATAAMSFGPAQAEVPEPAPSFVPGDQATVPGAQESLVDAAMRRAGAQVIATASRSTQVAMFPFPYHARLAGTELRGQVDAYVDANPGLLPPVNGGPERTGAYIESIAPQIDHPHAWAYASKAPGRTGCVILVPDRAVPEFGDLMRLAGVDRDTAAAFVLAHEAAHCAQYSEGIAALRDIALAGRVRSERVASNLLDVRFERLLIVGAPSGELLAKSVERTRSSERYADGFAVLTMLARGAITPRQLDGFAVWREAAASKDGHDTGSFLRHLKETIVAKPSALAAMRAPGEPGFDAQCVAAFLKPLWKAFEMSELEAESVRPEQKSRDDHAHSSTVTPMTTTAQRFTDQERIALELMLDAPEAVEFHGTDMTWQKALGQAIAPAQAKPSLKDVLMAGNAPPVDVPRG